MHDLLIHLFFSGPGLFAGHKFLSFATLDCTMSLSQANMGTIDEY